MMRRMFVLRLSRTKMKADKFNDQFEKLFVRPLLSAGFTQGRNCLFFVKEPTALMFLRHRNKWSALCQDTYFTVCVRHTFLRDLNTLMQPIYDYPFKIEPSRMVPDFFHCGWHYESFNEIGRWPKDEIAYGGMRDARAALDRLRSAVMDIGRSWLEFLQPAEAYRQIRSYGKSDYCEKLWLEDYEKYL